MPTNANLQDQLDAALQGHEEKDDKIADLTSQLSHASDAADAHLSYANALRSHIVAIAQYIDPTRASWIAARAVIEKALAMTIDSHEPHPMRLADHPSPAPPVPGTEGVTMLPSPGQLETQP